jgi:hypothetical protein
MTMCCDRILNSIITMSTGTVEETRPKNSDDKDGDGDGVWDAP